MRVLIACEYSGTVRSAFLSQGHDAWSCDIEPDENNSERHIQDDVRNLLGHSWDLMIAHPPCTYLSNSGVRWLFSDVYRWPKLFEAASFFKELLHAPIPYIAVENPVMHCYGRTLIGRGPDQTVQPWMFNVPESKAICLWLKNLPLLHPLETKRPAQTEQKVWRMSPGKDRAKERSRFYPEIAKQMAIKWGQA